MSGIEAYRNIVDVHGTQGYLRSDRALGELNVFGNSQGLSGRIGAWIKNPGKDGDGLYVGNQQTKDDFLREVGKKYGQQFMEKMKGLVGGDEGKPLSLRVIQQVITA